MTLEEALQNVQGWLSIEEANLLCSLAQSVQLPKMIVEIGSYQGRSTIALAWGAATPVFAIDPHVQSLGDPFQFGDQDRAALMQNLLNAGVAWKVRLLDMQSEFVAKGWPGHRIGLLWIDGAHNLDDVNKDLAGWLPFVDEGAWVAFHDSNAECVIQAVQGRTDLELKQAIALTTVYVYHRPPPLTQSITHAGFTWDEPGKPTAGNDEVTFTAENQFPSYAEPEPEETIETAPPKPPQPKKPTTKKPTGKAKR